jgi:ATP-dependent DNA helicase HFM1/MER3
VRARPQPPRNRFLPGEQQDRNLQSTAAVGEAFAHVFPYESFNAMQSECFDVLYNSDANVVVTGARDEIDPSSRLRSLCDHAAPTGSGKTVLFELAMCRFFAPKVAKDAGWRSARALYLAPLKVRALWERSKSFPHNGHTCRR